MSARKIELSYEQLTFTNLQETMTANLFSYGTLQLEQVQLKTFGRTLQGNPDILSGYKQSFVKINDKDVIDSGAITCYPVITLSGNASDIINGIVYILTEMELEQADNYEGHSYKRINVRLKSGMDVWVYVAAVDDH